MIIGKKGFRYLRMVSLTLIQLFNFYVSKPYVGAGVLALEAYVAVSGQLGEGRAEPRWDL